jgi:hypothetical protein
LLVALTATGGFAGPATGPAPQQWGDEIQGVRAGLRTDREPPVFAANQLPTFLASAKNDGQRNLVITRAQELAEIEIDGKWHRWIGDVDAKSSAFGHGKQYDDIAFRLVDKWSPIEGGGRLKLLPGKHTLRVALIADSFTDGQDPVRAVSNPIDFEILRPGAALPATRPVK